MRAAMPRAMAFRVVSLPAAMSREKNIESSSGESGSGSPPSPSTRAWTTAESMSSDGRRRFSSIRSAAYAAMPAAACWVASVSCPSSRSS